MYKPSKAKKSRKTGLAPGTPVFIGEVKVEEVSLSLINYNQEDVSLKKIEEDLLDEKIVPSKNTNWLNINGLHKLETIRKVCERWNIHGLVTEDIVNTMHRPKIEFFDNYIFVIAKMHTYNKDNNSLESEQVSFILVDNTVITFQERPGDVFGELRKRIKDGKGRIRKLKADYLLYCLLDSLVDSYYNLLEEIDNELDTFEQNVISNPNPDALQGFFSLKRSLLYLRKSVWPLREITSQLAKGDNELINTKTLPYLRDLYDHVIQVVDTVETFRDLANGLTEMYLSIVNNKMNEVMKVLTVCASIFIPLTFIVGVYGMNFEYIPELKWRSSYFVLWGIMISLTIGLIVFFKKKKWL